jgi:ribosomal protein L37E
MNNEQKLTKVVGSTYLHLYATCPNCGWVEDHRHNIDDLTDDIIFGGGEINEQVTCRRCEQSYEIEKFEY